MQVTLNLDTPEKQAFFLSLLNRPAMLVDALSIQLNTEIDEDGFENVLTGFENFTKLQEDEMYELLADIFQFEDWLKVRKEFMKV